MEIITRQEAIAQGLRHYFTGKPCEHGHTAQRWVKTFICVECNRMHKKAERQRNPEHVRKRKNDWHLKNKERVARRRKEIETEADRIKNRERAIAHYWANRERRLAAVKEYNRNNKAKILAHRTKRKIKIKRATPSWVDFEAIKKIYIKRQVVSERTGIQHHVDHIVPLLGKNVCGLHVPWNLQVIPAADNLRKSNKYDTA